MVIMCGTALYLRSHRSTQLLLIGLFAGLWLGALVAGVIWAFMRPSNGEEFPPVGPPGPVAFYTGALISPRLFVRDFMHWRHLTSTLRASRDHPSVRKHLSNDSTHVVAYLIAAFFFYFGSSAALLMLIWAR